MNKADAYQTILERWTITAEDLTKALDENPSLRGMLFGYVAEHKLHQYLSSFPSVSEIAKADDHNRKKKGDCNFSYKGFEFVLESKSLQTNSIKTLEDGTKRATAQVDASDRRKVTLPNGEVIETTNLLKGEFDILAVNCWAFTGDWDFQYALNTDLPLSQHRNYSEEARNNLLATSVTMYWPPKAPFVTDPFELLDKLVEERGYSQP